MTPLSRSFVRSPDSDRTNCIDQERFHPAHGIGHSALKTDATVFTQVLRFLQ